MTDAQDSQRPTLGWTPDRTGQLIVSSTELFVLAARPDREQVQIYEELALQFLPKVGPVERSRVASLLAGHAHAPPEVLKLLARDRIEVARPVLARADLTTVDLLGIVGGGTTAHREAIAGRREPPNEVVTALLRLAEPTVLAALVDNDTLTRAETELLAESVAAMPDLAGRLARRSGIGSVPNLPGFADLGTDARLGLIAETEARAALAAVLRPGRTSPLVEDVEALYDTLFRAAVRDDRDGFRAALVEASGLDDTTVAHALGDPGGEPAIVLLKAIGLPDTSIVNLVLLATDYRTSVETVFRLAKMLPTFTWRGALEIVESWRGDLATLAVTARAAVSEIGHPVHRPAQRPSGLTQDAARELGLYRA